MTEYSQVEYKNLYVKYDNKTLTIKEYSKDQLEQQQEEPIKKEEYKYEEWTENNYD